MGVHERVARGAASSGHVCQFFDSEESRADALSAFAVEGFRRNERILVVVRRVQWALMTERLAAAGIVVDHEIERGKLVVKDAVETLRHLSLRAGPTPAAFEDTVGTAVRALAALGPLRACGEMVDMLAQRGELGDAITLEGMWNCLAAATPLSMMCAYAAAHFVSPATHRALREICLAHTDVRRHEHDVLAEWLLTAAHNSVASSSWPSH